MVMVLFYRWLERLAGFLFGCVVMESSSGVWPQ